MSEDKPLPPRNTRRFRQAGDRKYLLLVIITLVFVGSILIALIYGPESLLTALPCLLGGAALILLPWSLLALLQKWRDALDESAQNDVEISDASSKDN